MPSLANASDCRASTDTLIVLLPGRGMALDELQREGFVDAIRASALAADLLRVDAHLGYYEARSVIDRLHDDVVAPARAHGYRHIWLAGISLGGAGALLYTQAHQTELEGLILLAPYLGEAGTIAAIQTAGGLQRWSPAVPPVPATELDDRLWRTLQALTADPAPLPVLLGYGLQDRLAPGHTVLAAALPAQQVFTAPGGHDWNPWLDLWRRMLAVAPLPRCSG